MGYTAAQNSVEIRTNLLSLLGVKHQFLIAGRSHVCAHDDDDNDGAIMTTRAIIVWEGCESKYLCFLKVLFQNLPRGTQEIRSNLR
jgi:hypothetical protein